MSKINIASPICNNWCNYMSEEEKIENEEEMVKSRAVVMKKGGTKAEAKKGIDALLDDLDDDDDL